MYKQKQLGRGMYQLFCVAVGLILMAPIFYAVSISFMRPEEILTTDLNLLPNSLYLGNYQIAIEQTMIFRFIFNSFVVAFVASFVRIILASLAAFSLAFFEYKGKKMFFYLVVGSMIIPSDLLLVQNFFTVARMDLVNTYLGIMIVFFFNAMSVFIMRQRFLTYSKFLREAALVDGCGNFRFYAQILVPSNIPVFATVFIVSFVGVWNTFLWPLMVTNVNEMRTAQMAITMLNIAEGSASYGPGTVMAAAVIILIPSIAVFVLFQKRIVGGLMTGSVKG
ncbi:MAG: carbohydrate ABC transporter permease [Defluviitaleaceae bacterium]|nr:carbohydrate ABC transporter permease [Defluviitaleaceae bacterium]